MKKTLINQIQTEMSGVLNNAEKLKDNEEKNENPSSGMYKLLDSLMSKTVI